MKNIALFLMGLFVVASPASAQIYSGARYHAPEIQSQYSNEVRQQPAYIAQQYNPPQYSPNQYSPNQYRQNYNNNLSRQRVCRVINNYLICN